MDDKTAAAIGTMLARWAEAVERFWTDWGDGSDLGCYGPGYVHWGVQSNWNYAAAMATLAAQPGVDSARWRERALAALRFALSTHVSGDRPGLNGEQWGHSWISMLGIERGMHGVAVLQDHLGAEDRAALHRMLASEADWLLHHGQRGSHHGIPAGLWNSGGQNAPESNIWSGALLWRAAQILPTHANAAAWRERTHAYLVNGVSVPADAQDGTLVAGRPVRDWHLGANFFPHYALDHHGYLNVGYMVICISNAAMLHFDLKRAGLPRPDSLDHHQHDLWQQLRRMIYSDGRLARIGGDSRVRYAYCQEYLLPALLYIADRWGDPHALSLAERQLVWMQAELEASDDGTFYGARMGHMREANPHYFTRLESDRACVLAMALNDWPLVDVPGPAQDVVSQAGNDVRQASRDAFEAAVGGGWIEPEHGAVLQRSPRRLASFSWRAQGLTQAMCQPPDDGHLGEWALNLCPEVRFLGDDGQRPGTHRRLLRQRVASFDGGFTACGAVVEGVDVRIDEGAHCTDQAVTQIAFAALPDDRTCLGLQYTVTAIDRVGFTVAVKSLHLNVPNDLFNQFRHQIDTANGRVILTSPPAADEVVRLDSRWANVDGKIGVVALYGGDSLVVDRARQRRGGRYRSLYVDELCLQAETALVRRGRGEVLVDVGFALLSGAGAGETAALQSGPLTFEQRHLRGVWAVGADARRYAWVANFGPEAVDVQVLGHTVEVAGGEGQLVCQESGIVR